MQLMPLMSCVPTVFLNGNNDVSIEYHLHVNNVFTRILLQNENFEKKGPKT